MRIVSAPRAVSHSDLRLADDADGQRPPPVRMDVADGSHRRTENRGTAGGAICGAHTGPAHEALIAAALVGGVLAATLLHALLER